MDCGQLRFWCVEDKHSEDRCVANHQISRVDFSRTPTANDNDATSLCQNLEIFPEIYVRQHLDENVDAVTVRQCHHLIQMAQTPVVQSRVSAVLGYERPSPIGSCRSDNPHSRRAGQLQRGNTDPTTRTMNQNCLCRLRVSNMKESAVCGHIRQ